MGGGGTDVAREASSIVLLHDFGSICRPFRVGAAVSYDNLPRPMGYIICAIHGPSRAIGELAVLFGSRCLLLTPMPDRASRALIDPAMPRGAGSVNGEAEVIRRPRPRARAAALLSGCRSSPGALVQHRGARGGVAANGTVAMRSGMALDAVRAQVILAWPAANIALIFVNCTSPYAARHFPAAPTACCVGTGPNAGWP
jgi:Ca2+-transporting ATPase